MQTSDVSIASKSLPLIQTKKTSKTISENSTINKESIKELKPRKHLALRKPINLFMYTRKLAKQIFQKNKNKKKIIVPIPNFFYRYSTRNGRDFKSE